MDSFKSWLSQEEEKTVEVSTDTGQIATFARPIGQIVRRNKKKNDRENLQELPTF